MFRPPRPSLSSARKKRPVAVDTAMRISAANAFRGSPQSTFTTSDASSGTSAQGRPVAWPRRQTDRPAAASRRGLSRPRMMSPQTFPNAVGPMRLSGESSAAAQEMIKEGREESDGSTAFAATRRETEDIPAHVARRAPRAIQRRSLKNGPGLSAIAIPLSESGPHSQPPRDFLATIVTRPTSTRNVRNASRAAWLPLPRSAWTRGAVLQRSTTMRYRPWGPDRRRPRSTGRRDVA